MKTYQCHKVVEAGIVDSIPERAFAVQLIDGEFVPVPKEFFARGYPKPGDYLVRYEDGYLSWSPKAVFEAGYSEVQS